MTELDGRVAVLTGASRGLGVDIARRLAAAGARLALAARSAEALDGVRDEIQALGTDAVAIPTDVTSADDRRRLVDEVERHLGPVDVLVNNAGVEDVMAFELTDAESIDQVLAVNLTAALQLTRLVVPGMLERGRGHVVNVASGAGKSGVPFAASYSASKFGLVGASQALRAEYFDTPLRFSVVCPGFVTDEGMYARLEEEGISAPRLLGTTTPAKVADAVLDAVRRDRVDVIVNDVPLRPVAALSVLFPKLHAPIAKAIGLTEMGRRASTRRRS